MRAVWIEFTSPAKWFVPYSWLIRLFERTRYSHVRIRFQTGWFTTFIFEAAGSAVRLLGQYGIKQNPVKIHHSYILYLTHEQYQELMKLTRYAGVKYGVFQAIGIGVQRLLGLKRNPWADKHYSFICSELVAYFLFDVLKHPVPINKFADFESAGPRAIKEWLDAHPEIAKKVA